MPKKPWDAAVGIRLYQCPGCWSWGMHKVPTTDRWLECDCGEKMDCIDLRGEYADDMATWNLHHLAALGGRDDSAPGEAEPK